MIRKTLFKNRLEAGQKLGLKLRKLGLKKPIVLALPSGGVIVADQVAQLLECPLDLIVVQKIFYPFEESLGFGAVGPKFGFYSDKLTEGIPRQIIDAQTKAAIEKRKKREETFFKTKKGLNLRGKEAIIIDDTLATGLSVLTAIQSIMEHKPLKIIVACPAISVEGKKLIQDQVDKIITLYQHPEESLSSVSIAYKDYPEINNKQVSQILKKHKKHD